MLNMEDKQVVIITGSSGGIGCSIVEKFKEKGWIVVGIDKNKSQNVDMFFKIDLSNTTDFSAYMVEIINYYGRIDCLVNNAAMQICKSWDDYSIQDWDNTFNCNVKSCYLLSTACRPYLKTVKGSIINICSVHCISTSVDIGLYAVSKSALLGLTKSMSLEYIKDDININAISPGAIKTPMLMDGINRNTDPQKALDKLKSGCPYNDIGEPNEIAKMVYFLTKINYLIGENIVVDGGVSIQLPTE